MTTPFNYDLVSQGIGGSVSVAIVLSAVAGAIFLIVLAYHELKKARAEYDEERMKREALEIRATKLREENQNLNVDIDSLQRRFDELGHAASDLERKLDELGKQK